MRGRRQFPRQGPVNNVPFLVLRDRSPSRAYLIVEQERQVGTQSPVRVDNIEFRILRSGGTIRTTSAEAAACCAAAASESSMNRDAAAAAKNTSTLVSRVLRCERGSGFDKAAARLRTVLASQAAKVGYRAVKSTASMPPKSIGAFGTVPSLRRCQTNGTSQSRISPETIVT